MLTAPRSKAPASLPLGESELIVRSEAASLEAAMSQYLVRQVRAIPNVGIRLGTEIVGGGGNGWLTHLVVRDRATGEEETLPADELFLAIGANPRTDWLPDAIARDDQINTPQMVRNAFEARAQVDNINSVKAADLEITKEGNRMAIGFAYRKEVPLTDKVGLYIDYAASTQEQ